MVKVFAFGAGFSRGYFDFGVKIFISRKDTKKKRKNLTFAVQPLVSS